MNKQNTIHILKKFISFWSSPKMIEVGLKFQKKIITCDANIKLFTFRDVNT